MTVYDLKDTVTISSVAVAAGAETLTTVEADVPAAIQPTGGGMESLDLGQVVARQSYRVTLRYRTDLTPRHRLSWVSPFGTKVLTIAALADLSGDRRWLTLECVERV